jgi:hypothetical protein
MRGRYIMILSPGVWLHMWLLTTYESNPVAVHTWAGTGLEAMQGAVGEIENRRDVWTVGGRLG